MVHVLRPVWFLLAPALVSIFSMQCLAGPGIRIFDMATNRQIDVSYKACDSKFGQPPVVVGGKGFVAYNLADGTGCNSSLVPPPPRTYDYSNEQWILLLERGQCSFADKVRNAQLKQYDMVIVFNDKMEKFDIAPMYGIDTSDILIPSLFVSHDTGSILKAKYQYFYYMYVIVDDYPQMFII